jgi:hypothetical protein
MSNDTGVHQDHPAIVRPFYLAASQHKGAKEYETELREVLRLIEQGEKFKGYVTGDRLESYRQRLRVNELIADPSVSEDAKRVLQEAIDEHRVLDFAKLIKRVERGLPLADPEKPEPKDKTSNEWRYWKIRQLEAGFDGPSDAKGYELAWDEFKALLRGLMSDENFWHVSNAKALLPHLIIARQSIDKMNAREKRSQAAMKGAQTRRKKGGKR